MAASAARSAGNVAVLAVRAIARADAAAANCSTLENGEKCITDIYMSGCGVCRSMYGMASK